ncbi:hypothetical protein HELRODRAFT_179285 [Helobdella robusta]|uniref:Uncharacterized protein n=1 Tax=Helobdella robusta TaxID=6412 RepID=T1FEH3_HELRO|nr:hypothetical protein HELRODRAFT_179285 [Helobdella robusta]ESN95509.1 hypothetical protein HELRODRAFT_179285 [Helobdella robusta]
MGKNYFIDYIALVSRCWFPEWNTVGEVRGMPAFPNAARDLIFIVSLLLRCTSERTVALCNTYPGEVPTSTKVTLQCNANLPAYRYIIAHQAVGAFDGYFSFCDWKLMSRSFFHQTNCIKLGEYLCDSFNFNEQLNICQLNKHRNGYLNGSLITNTSCSFWVSHYYYYGNV